MAVRSPRPMTRHRRPRYPTRLEAQGDPDLLYRHVPPAWLARAELTGALGICLVATGTGCTEEASSAPATAMVPTMSESPPLVLAPPAEEARDGTSRSTDNPRTMTLGIVATPPVLLSEEEALVCIQKALSQHGIHLSERGFVMDSVLIEGVVWASRYEWLNDKETADLKEVTEALEVDLRDPRRNVGVEYVTYSLDRFFSRRWVYSSDLGDSSKAIAESIARKVASDGKEIRLGVFHDPSNKLDDELRWARSGDNLTEAKAQCRRLLRLQVKSFVEWLQGQGAI